MKRMLACAVIALSGAPAVASEPCTDNFKVEGNVFTGKTYKTTASITGVKQADAFARVQAFTVSNGFTVLSADKEAGVISATQTVSYGQGKTVPLGIVMQPEGDALKISMNYATSGGVISPEAAIRKHFCLTVAAAAGTGPVAAVAGTATAAPAAPAQRPTMRGFAVITPAQQQALERELNKAVPGDMIRKLLTEAAPAITTYIERVACLADYQAAKSLDEFAVPGKELSAFYVAGRPMQKPGYHDKSSCMTVARVHGWSAPANNALRFEVMYKADDSGEVVKITHEAIRQPDGVWLFTR